MIIHGTVYKNIDGEVYHRRYEYIGLRHIRNCPYCNWWFTRRPDLRRHIKNEHQALPQYRRRPKEDWYDQSKSTNNR